MKNPLPLLFLPDPRLHRSSGREEMALQALRGGASAVQLRAKDLTVREMVEAGRNLGRLCRERGRPFFVNDRVDVALACGADGVHIGPDDMAPEDARQVLGPEALIGVSVYGAEDVERAEEAGAAYVSVGAVYPTSSKAVDVVGMEGLARMRERTALPIVAIGGIEPANVQEVIAAGADGVAVISSISCAEDIEGRARELRRLIDAALSSRR